MTTVSPYLPVSTTSAANDINDGVARGGSMEKEPSNSTSHYERQQLATEALQKELKRFDIDGAVPVDEERLQKLAAAMLKAEQAPSRELKSNQPLMKALGSAKQQLAIEALQKELKDFDVEAAADEERVEKLAAAMVKAQQAPSGELSGCVQLMEAYVGKMEAINSAVATDLMNAAPALERSYQDMMDYRSVETVYGDLRKLEQMSVWKMRINPWLVDALMTHGEASISGEMEILGIVAALLCSFVVGAVIEPPEDISRLGANAFLVSFGGTLCSTVTSAMCLIRFAQLPAKERVAVMEVYGTFMWIPSLSLVVGVVFLLVAMMDVAMTLHADLYHSPIAIITTATTALCIIMLMWINRGVTELSRDCLMERLRENTDVSIALHMPKAVDAESTYKAVSEVVKPKVEALLTSLAGTASAREKLEQQIKC